MDKGHPLSLKDNLDEVKGELLGESRFLEQFIRLEKFVKKYKTPFLGAIALAVLLALGNAGYGVWQEYKLGKANAAYLALVKNAGDKEALADLESANPALFRLYQLHQAAAEGDLATLETLSKSEDPLVARLAAYQLASQKGDAAATAEYALRGDALLKEFTLLQQAKLAYDAGENDKAKSALSAIPFTSPLKSTATVLEHYDAR